MTGHSETWLTCDRETSPPTNGTKNTCTQRFGPTTSSIDKTRVVARRYNWTHAGQHDYCPRCSRWRASNWMYPYAETDTTA